MRRLTSGNTSNICIGAATRHLVKQRAAQTCRRSDQLVRPWTDRRLRIQGKIFDIWAGTLLASRRHPLLRRAHRPCRMFGPTTFFRSIVRIRSTITFENGQLAPWCLPMGAFLLIARVSFTTVSETGVHHLLASPPRDPNMPVRQPDPGSPRGMIDGSSPMGGLPGRIAGLSGIDPDNPDQRVPQPGGRLALLLAAQR